MKKLNLLFLLAGSCILLRAQTFDPVQVNGLPALSNGDMAWGDFDNDGDLDVILSGHDGTEAITRVYRNEGTNTFTIVPDDIINLEESDIELADLNQDGYLDIALIGTDRTGHRVATVYLNNRDMSFVDMDPPLKILRKGALEISEMDGNAYPDIVLSGLDEHDEPVVRVYTSNGNQFIDSGIRLKGLYEGDMDVADLDKNGLNDIILTGLNLYGDRQFIRHMQITPGKFSNPEDFPLGAGLFIETLWEDLNDDGYIDLISYQLGSNGFETVFYKNQKGKLIAAGKTAGIDRILRDEFNSTSTFSLVTGIPEIFQQGESGLMEWQDIDLDGNREIVQIGRLKDGSPGMYILQQTDPFSFSLDSLTLDMINSEVPVGAQWYDFDGDGDKDLMVLGWLFEAYQANTQIFLNEGGSLKNMNIFVPGLLGEARLFERDGEYPPELILSGDVNNGYYGLGFFELDTNRYAYAIDYSNFEGNFVLNGAFTGEEFFGGEVDITLENREVVPIEIRFGPGLSQKAHRFTVPPGATSGVPIQQYAYQDYVDVPFEAWDIENNRQVMISFRDQDRNGVFDLDTLNEDDPDEEWREYIFLHSQAYAESPSEEIMAPLGISWKLVVAYWMFRESTLQTWNPEMLPESTLELLVATGSYVEYQSPVLDLNPSLDFADYNNDGNMDIAAIREDYPENALHILEQEGDTYQEILEIPLPHMSSQGVRWHDYDGDGDLDIMHIAFYDPVEGIGAFRYVVNVLKNGATGFEFVENVIEPILEPLPGVPPRISLADIDSDGISELLFYAAREDYSANNLIYKLAGDRYELYLDRHPATTNGELLTEDLNGDGLLDVLLSGTSASDSMFYFLNNENDSLYETATTIPAIEHVKMVSADFDQDGQPDLIISGESTGSAGVQLISFDVEELNTIWERDAPAASLLGMNYFNDDLSPDIVFSGRSETTYALEAIGVNPPGAPNQPPAVPGNLAVDIHDNLVTIFWSAANDDITPTASLSYNLEITSGDQLILSGESLSSGQRLVLRHGNTSLKTSYTLELDQGTYAVKVQSIDGNFAGSAFSDPVEFTVDAQLDQPLFIPVVLDGINDEVPESPTWIDFDNNGFPDLIFSEYVSFEEDGQYFEESFLRIYSNTGNLNLTRVNDLKYRSEPIRDNVEPIDANNDGLTDFVYEKSVFVNRGNFQFDQIELPITESTIAESTVIDYDNDGLEDIQYGLTILKNLGDLQFAAVTGFLRAETPFESSEFLGVNWGDYDNDSDPDLLVTEDRRSDGYYQPLLLENDGSGQLVQTNFLLPVPEGNRVYTTKWLDFDHDGDLDIWYHLVDFWDPEEPSYFYIYENTPEGFVELSISLDTIDWANHTPGQWADFDLDGDLDLTMGGFLFEYESGELVIRESLESAFTFFEEAPWVDIDADGDPDILTSKNLLINNSSKSNAKPEPPVNLNAVRNETGFELTWDSGSDDATHNLSYHIYIKQNDQYIVSPVGGSSRQNDASQMGNATHARQYQINNLPDGDYSFAVQAIDHGFLRSEFSNEFEFSVRNFSRSSIPELANTYPETLVAGDLDADGHLDILVHGYDIEGNELTGIFFNQDGVFEFQDLGSDFGTMASSNTMGAGAKLADFNGDGLLDILGSFNYETHVLINQGNRQFQDAVQLPFEGWVFATGDLNGDFRPDFVVSGYSYENDQFETVWYRNEGNQRFIQAGIIDATYEPNRIELNDYDLDGDADLFFSGSFPYQYPGRTFMLRNNEQSFEQAGIDLPAHQTFGSDVVFADFDGDHDTDILVCGLNAAMYQQDANGGFSLVDFEFPEANGRTRCGDFDGDGDPDLLFVGNGQTVLTLNLGNNIFKNVPLDVETFQPGISFEGTGDPRSITGDFNGDGKLDFMIAGFVTRDSMATILYYNESLRTSNPPAAPENLDQVVFGNRAVLSWEHVFNSSYSVQLKSDTEETIIPAQTDGRSLSLLPAAGALSYRNILEARQLADGLYNWQVLTTNNIYQLSRPSEIMEFIVCDAFENAPISINGIDDVGINGQQSLSVSDTAQGQEINWDFGDGSESSDRQATHSYTTPGIYTVRARITNSIGCVRTIEQDVIVQEKIPVRVATVMTPNGDGFNDILFVENIENYPDNSIRILNSYGQEVYSATGYANTWEGQFNGKLLPPGSYVCILKLEAADAERKTMFSILR